METAPATEVVYQNVYALYNNPDANEKEKASRWLEQLQKSIYSWNIADQLLEQKRDLHSCYFAAQTMRSKIQNSFHELPPSAHISLRDSLINHIRQIDNETDPIIVTQLCLALADLALLMATWQNPILELIDKLGNNILSLIVVITFIPEEINSRYLRLGSNRREEIHRQLEANARSVSDLLVACMQNGGQNPIMVHKVIRCFNSWIGIHAIDICDVINNIIVVQSLNLLNNQDTDSKLHDAAADCLCTLLQRLEDNNNKQILEAQLFNNVLQLEGAYHMAVAHEDLDRAISYCRIFTVLAETFLDKIILESEQSPFYANKSLDLVLNCVGHYDYEVAEITFMLWYRLSEDLYKRNNDALTIRFRPYIERLIGALYRHSQMDSDHNGLIDEHDSFYDFRKKVADLIKDVVFVIGSSNCFKQMFLLLQEQNVTWESSEAALFVMENVAKNLLPEENEVAPKVVEAILNLPENTHIAVRYTSIMLLGELSEWIENHPASLQAVLNFLLHSLQQRNGLAAAAATALTAICTACRHQMTCHLNGLVQIAGSLDSFEISNDSAIGLLKGISIIVSRLPPEQLAPALLKICSFQLSALCALIETDIKVEKYKRSDPSFWMDRLSAILRHTTPNVPNNMDHPCLCVITETWPIISRVLEKYQNDVHVMERAARCIRYSIRCIGKQATPLLEPLVKQIVLLYGLHQHSCFLYLGSILVDEFADISDMCTQGLLDMLQSFIEPTFKILQVENGLKNHPDTVDDFFRLCSRFILRCSIPFLQSNIVGPIIQLALLSCTLDHQDASLSVMKFFYNLLNCGQSEGDTTKRHLVHQIVLANGDALVINLLHSSVFCLQTCMLSDVADIFLVLKLVDHTNAVKYFRNALDALPKKNSGGCITATQSQVDDFHMALIRADTSKGITYALKDFTRLYR